MHSRLSLTIFISVLLNAHSYVVNENQVTFYLRTRETDEVVQITNEIFPNISPNKKFNFVIHGWIASHSEEWVQNMTNAYLKQDDCNVIQVDWEEPAAQWEYISANNTKGVGYFVGRFIIKLIEDLLVPPENISIVGHSFGSHVSGFAAKEVKRSKNVQIGRITATDPARRPFEGSLISDSDKLSKEDAVVVAAIHSDAGTIGLLKPIGTLDFYPNGGLNPQPGCENSEDTHACGHIIVNWFLIEAIEQPDGFLSFKCDSYEKYLNNECVDNESVTLGSEIGDLEGIFYFQTNPQPPYSKN